MAAATFRSGTDSANKAALPDLMSVRAQGVRVSRTSSRQCHRSRATFKQNGIVRLGEKDAPECKSPWLRIWQGIAWLPDDIYSGRKKRRKIAM